MRNFSHFRDQQECECGLEVGDYIRLNIDQLLMVMAVAILLLVAGTPTGYHVHAGGSGGPS